MLRLAPISDYLNERCEGVLNETQSLDPDMGFRNRDKYKESKFESHVRYYIKLDDAVPVINPLTCGQQYLKAARILGLQKAVIEAVVDFRIVWDTNKKCLIPIEQSDSPLFNGAALECEIENLKIEDSIEEILSNIASKAVDGACAVNVQRNASGYRFYSCYTVQLSLPGDEEIPTDVYRKLDKAVKRHIANGSLQRVNMLINLMNAHSWSESAVKSYLKKIFIIRDVVVVPYTLRPAMDRRKHPMTQAYARLFQANTEVFMYKNGRIDDFKEHYRKIVHLVQSIMTENMYSKSDLKSLDPLLKRIKGKNGMIRSTMLKKRQDYSGRAAVIVDPFLPVNCVGIPKTMAVKLYRRYLTADCNVSAQTVLEKINDPEFVDTAIRLLKKHGILDEVPSLLGRNPTLHKHGIQGFYVRIVDGRAIRVNPLVCPAYNMDFDGDAAHTEVPITRQAQYEIRKLIMTERNIILPKTGTCTICPEKDVVYGLYVCTCFYENAASGGSYPDVSSLKEALYAQKCYVWDNVTVGGVGSGLAGRLAFESCFPAKIAKSLEKVPVTQGVMKDCIKQIQGLSTETFCSCVNRLVELGMKVAYLYSKSVSVLAPLNANKDFDRAISDFEKEMEEVYELSDFGFYDSDSFENDFSIRQTKANNALKKNIMAKMPDNMFKAMAVSGARGSEGNLVQMFGAKGRIQKSESDSFNILINKGMFEQLTPMDQAISANGARRGQISKSIKTADTGYLGRKLNHASGPIVITEVDCGTRDGITVSFEDIRNRYITETMTEDDITAVGEKAEATMVKFIVGKYQTSNNMLITEPEAKRLAQMRKPVKVRSPITCKNPCCAKCYGLYCETTKIPPKGFPVGFIAAAAMSEPSTQLVMKEFQKGGVVGAASPFDRLNSLLCGQDIKTKAAQGEYPTYDPVAWAPGTVVKEDYNNLLVLLRIVPDNDVDDAEYEYTVNRLAPSSALYKVGQHVEPGETLRVAHGDTYIPEMLKFAGLEAAQLEMLYSLYFLFKSQVDLLPIHFEVMISACTGYLPVNVRSPRVRLGKYYTKRLLVDINEDVEDLQENYIPKICGVDEIVLGSPNFMEAFIMEDQREALSEAVCNCLYDVVDSPLVQLSIGQRVKVGTGYSSTFLEDIE